jgi:hypothetical protein
MNYLRVILISISALIGANISGQGDFTMIETELAFQCDVMTNTAAVRHRKSALEKFNESFIAALQKSESFAYPFDSLKWISAKYSDDKSFRIFTWEVKLLDGDVKYNGVLQKSDGRIFVLNDRFKQSESLKDEEFDHDNWLGSLYYHIMPVTSKKTNEKYYLLFGINRWSRFENVKLVDVLFFTKEGLPYFGKQIFRSKEDGRPDSYANRLVFRYAADAQMTVNYNPGMEMIVYDNLIPKMSRIPGQGETLVPDGSYVGFEFDGMYWNRIDKIATQVMDTAPRPKPILDQRKGKKIFGN